MSKSGEQPIKQSSGKAKSVHATSTPATHARLMPDRVWLVLARRTYDEPLRQIGTVEADDGDLAGVYASSIYDEFAWIEMAVIPREALVTVIHA